MDPFVLALPPTSTTLCKLYEALFSVGLPTDFLSLCFVASLKCTTYPGSNSGDNPSTLKKTTAQEPKESIEVLKTKGQVVGYY